MWMSSSADAGAWDALYVVFELGKDKSLLLQALGTPLGDYVSITGAYMANAKAAGITYQDYYNEVCLRCWVIQTNVRCRVIQTGFGVIETSFPVD